MRGAWTANSESEAGSLRTRGAGVSLQSLPRDGARACTSGLRHLVHVDLGLEGSRGGVEGNDLRQPNHPPRLSACEKGIPCESQTHDPTNESDTRANLPPQNCCHSPTLSQNTMGTQCGKARTLWGGGGSQDSPFSCDGLRFFSCQDVMITSGVRVKFLSTLGQISQENQIEDPET